MQALDLVIYGIIAIVLVIMAVTLFNGLNSPKALSEEIKEALIIAKTPASQGQILSLGSKNIERDYILSKGFFETTNLSLAFECNNPKICCIRKSIQEKSTTCEKAIEWDYDFVKIKTQILTKIGVRCITQNDLPVCRIYIGENPAQASIISIKKEDNLARNIFIIKTKNIGENNLVNSELNLILQKYVNGVWENTESTFETKTITEESESTIILPNQEHTFIWEINPTTRGTYKAIFTYSGQNAGYSKKDSNFEVSFNSNCTPIIETSYNIIENSSGDIVEQKTCQGCNYPYECATAWQTKYPENNYEVLTKDTTECLRAIKNKPCESGS